MRSRYSQIKTDRYKESERQMYTGFWHGRPVTFPREFRGHLFSEEECEALCKGQRIEVHNIQGMNCKYAVQGRLQVQDIGLGPSVRFVVIDTVPNNPDYVFGMELYPVSDASELSDVWKGWDEMESGRQEAVQERRPFDIQKAFAASRNRISEIEKQGDRHVFAEPETYDVSDVFEESEASGDWGAADSSEELELSDADMAYMLGESDGYEESVVSDVLNVSDVQGETLVQEELESEEMVVPDDAEVLVDEDAEAAVAAMMEEEEEQMQQMGSAVSEEMQVSLPADETPDGDFSDTAYDFDGYGVGTVEPTKPQETAKQKFSDDSGINNVFAEYLKDEDSEDAMSEGFAYVGVVEEEQYDEYWEEVAELDRKTAELAGDHPWDDPTKPVTEELMQSVSHRVD